MSIIQKNKKKIYFFVIIILILIISLTISAEILINSIIIQKNISTHFTKEKKSKRIIEESDNKNTFESNVEKICKKASSKLQKYYETYDNSIMDVSSKHLEVIEYYPDYIKAIFNMIENKGDIQENLLNYIKHAVLAFIFLILGIVCAVAWLFFCFFCCCNCCCCCCCKYPECKCTFLFVPIIFDLVVIICCVVGIFTSSKMFTGLADVECSLMKFISEINGGEKRDGVKWIGFGEILNTFEKIKTEINRIKTERETQLNEKYADLTELKEDFPEFIKGTYRDMLDPYDPDSPLIFDTSYLMQIMEEGTLNRVDVGVLDILYNYGPITNDERFLYQLNEQCNVLTKQADEYLKKAHDSFQKLFQDNAITNLMEAAINSINELMISIDGIKDEIGKYVVDYSDPIESYGKYIVKIIYIVILSLSCFSGITIVMMYITAEECCYGKCCCGKGLSKTLSHISWNLMSLILIFSFIICGIVFLLSYLGKDLVKVISVIFGLNNLYSNNPILIKGDVSDYFSECLHGDGDLAYIFGLTMEESPTYEFDELNSIINDIDEIYSQITQSDVVIGKFKEELENRKNYHDVNIYDFNNSIWVNLDKLIYTFNDLIINEEGDVWTLNETCPKEDYLLVHPPAEPPAPRKTVEDPISKECLIFGEWKEMFEQRYKSPPILVLDITYTTVLKASKFYVAAVNNITDYIDNGLPIGALEERIDLVETAYNEVIDAELDVLEIYNKTVYDIIAIFNKLNKGGDSLFSFLNCKFIGNNVLIILKNLEESFAGNVMRIGLTLVFASFGMFFSIVFTILEIVILNVSLYLQKRRKEKEEQITLAMAAATRVMTFTETERKEKDLKEKKKSKSKFFN